MESAPAVVLQSHFHETQTPRSREWGLDVARLIAALSICWLHTWESQLRPRPGELGRFAVPFFVVTAVGLMCRGAVSSKRSFASYAWNRFCRIYIPFLGWTLIYFIVTDLKHRLITHEPLLPAGFYVLWVGTAAHLWFLPFLFLINLSLFSLCRFLFQRPGWLPIVGVVAIGIGLAWMKVPFPHTSHSADEHNNIAQIEYFMVVAWSSIPAIFFGIALAAFIPTLRIGNIGLLGAILAPVCMGLVYLHGRNILLENIAGVAWAIAAFVPLHAAWARIPARLGAQAYGIYLSHYLIAEGFRALTVKLHIHNSTGVVLADFALVVFLSIAITLTLYHYRQTRWLVGQAAR